MDIIEAEEQHINAMQQIYAWHVVNGSASFETTAPGRDEMLARLHKTRSAGLPWFVVLEEDVVKGYCYLSHYRTRYAYRYTLEDSIYIDEQFRQRGAGKALLKKAIEWAQSHGYRQLVAVVGNSENVGSLRLHEQAGFALTGTLNNVGFKHGRWLDIVIMQRTLGEGSSTLPVADVYSRSA